MLLAAAPTVLAFTEYDLYTCTASYHHIIGPCHRVHILVEMNRVSVSAHSAGAYTATLLVMVIVVKGGGRVPPTLTSQANFTLMMECTPESGRYNSVYSVGPWTKYL